MIAPPRKELSRHSGSGRPFHNFSAPGKQHKNQPYIRGVVFSGDCFIPLAVFLKGLLGFIISKQCFFLHIKELDRATFLFFFCKGNPVFT